jgi:chromosome partitioning protein
MPVIAVINRKGGSGKSTLATHLAAHLARGGTPVMLGDADRQQSTVPWLQRRAALGVPGLPIVGWQVDPRNTLRPPPGVNHIVLDTPGGLQGFDLARLLLYADAVLMPVCDSAFDRESAAATWAELRAHPRVAAGRCQAGAVGMRIDGRTQGDAALRSWAALQQLPWLGSLRATQTYVRCTDRGLTVFDLPAHKVEADLEQWQPVLDWLRPVLEAAPAAQEPRAANAPPAASARPVLQVDPLAALERRGGAALNPGRFWGLRRWLSLGRAA